MKTRSIVFALLLSIGLFATSCDNTDNEGDTLAPIVGKWDISKVGTNFGGAETLIDPPQNQAGCDHDYINLKIDYTLVSGDYDSSVSACALTTQSGTYSKSGSKLTLVVNGVSTTYDVINLTLSQLKLQQGNNVSIYIR